MCTVQYCYIIVSRHNFTVSSPAWLMVLITSHWSCGHQSLDQEGSIKQQNCMKWIINLAVPSLYTNFVVGGEVCQVFVPLVLWFMDRCTVTAVVLFLEMEEWHVGICSFAAVECHPGQINALKRVHFKLRRFDDVSVLRNNETYSNNTDSC